MIWVIAEANEIVSLLVELPAHFSVWLASKDAEFLKSKMVW